MTNPPFGGGVFVADGKRSLQVTNFMGSIKSLRTEIGQPETHPARSAVICRLLHASGEDSALSGSSKK